LSNSPATFGVKISYHTHSLVTERFCNDSKDWSTKQNVMKGTAVLQARCPPTPRLHFPSTALVPAAMG